MPNAPRQVPKACHITDPTLGLVKSAILGTSILRLRKKHKRDQWLREKHNYNRHNRHATDLGKQYGALDDTSRWIRRSPGPPNLGWSRPAPPEAARPLTASPTASPTLEAINTPLGLTCEVWKLSSSYYRLVLYH